MYQLKPQILELHTKNGARFILFSEKQYLRNGIIKTEDYRNKDRLRQSPKLTLITWRWAAGEMVLVLFSFETGSFSIALSALELAL